MKRLLLTSIAALLLATGTAHADEDAIMRRERNLPQKQYDHAFDGEVLIIPELSQKELIDNCNLPKDSILKGRLFGGCVRHLPEFHRCMILLAEREAIRWLGNPVEEDVIRHEIGHCNGWPADHPRD